MRIRVNIIGREPFGLEVEPYYTVTTLKRKIEYLHGISMVHQIVSHNSQIIEEDKIFSNLNVKMNDVFIVRLNPSLFRLQCEVSSNKTIFFCVEPSITVKELKQKIFLTANINPIIQRIELNGILLEDNQCLSFYKINSCSLLVVKSYYRSIINDLISISLCLEEMSSYDQ